jgi:hypothetical protein
MFDEATLAKRKPLWSALSELWLDTELGAVDLDRIAVVMDKSGLTLDELRDVFFREVAPVCWRNHAQVAGEWAGFDPEALAEAIQATLRDRPGYVRFVADFAPARWFVTRTTRADWHRLRDRVRRARGIKRS